MTDDPDLDVLDHAVRAAAAAALVEGEVIVTWVAVVGTRTMDGQGNTITVPMEGRLPTWMVRGLLEDGRRYLDTQQTPQF